MFVKRDGLKSVCLSLCIHCEGLTVKNKLSASAVKCVSKGSCTVSIKRRAFESSKEVNDFTGE